MEKRVIICAFTVLFLIQFVSCETPVSNCQELQDIRNDLTGTYYLTNNIDCTGFDYGDGKGFMPLGYGFNGTFDGRGFNITGLKIDRSVRDSVNVWGNPIQERNDNVGLFSSIAGATISNVGLIDVNISGGEKVGALVGGVSSGGAMHLYVPGSTIENSFSTGYVSGKARIGGLIGSVYGVSPHKINNCYSMITILGNQTGSNHVGGLIGYFDGGTITNSYADIYFNGRGHTIGGFVGSIGEDDLIVNCSSRGDIGLPGTYSVGGLVGRNRGQINSSYSETNVYSSGIVGGLVGENDFIVANCYAIGNVTGNSYSDGTGSLVGFNYGIILNSYSTGYIGGNTVNQARGMVGIMDGPVGTGIKSSYTISEFNTNQGGGVVGVLEFGYISNCYWNNVSAEYNSVYSCIGTNKLPPGYGVVADNCFTVQNDEYYFYDYSNSPFYNWDFDNIWSNSKEGLDHPVFKWQEASGSVPPPTSCTPDCGSRECGPAPNGCGGSNECGTCSGGQTCSASGTCVSLSPGPLTLNWIDYLDGSILSEAWVNLNGGKNNRILLSLENSNLISGTEVNFTIYERDCFWSFCLDDEIRKIPTTIEAGGNAKVEWIPTQEDIEATGEEDDFYKFYFTVTGVEDGGCTPDCGSRECGPAPNGCGGSNECGTCSGGQTCSASGTCVSSCTPDCSCASITCIGNTCPDGCGGDCVGTLSPDCGSRECGPAPNGCGGSNECGSCGTNAICSGGNCICDTNGLYPFKISDKCYNACGRLSYSSSLNFGFSVYNDLTGRKVYYITMKFYDKSNEVSTVLSDGYGSSNCGVGYMGWFPNGNFIVGSGLSSKCRVFSKYTSGSTLPDTNYCDDNTHSGMSNIDTSACFERDISTSAWFFKSGGGTHNQCFL